MSWRYGSGHDKSKLVFPALPINGNEKRPHPSFPSEKNEPIYKCTQTLLGFIRV